MYPAVISVALLLMLAVSVESVTTASLTVIHFNDFHSRFEPVNPKTAGLCKEDIKDTCVGGFARLHGKINELKNNEPQALVVNAGDVFTGTLWFKLFKWNVTAEFMNLLPVDVQTLGNHEFDIEGVDAAVKYLSKIEKTPTVITNLNAQEEPQLEPFIQKSIIVSKNGLRVGIVGYITPEYKEITADFGKLDIEDEISVTNEEIKRLRDNGLVDVILAVTHAGYKRDLEVATVLDADIIVGGHSHTFLYTGTPPSDDRPAGKYPTVVSQKTGRRVLVVQAGANSKYLGYLKVQFEKKDTNGRYELASFEGNPIWLDKTVNTDGGVEAKLVPWRSEVHRIGSKKVGSTLVNLDITAPACEFQECLIGRMVADSWIYEYTKKREGRSWSRAPVALVMSMGIRSSFATGDITLADVWNVLPFEDQIGMVELNGQHFQELLELAVGELNSVLQMSGVKAKIDMNKPMGERVSDVFVRCATCPVPIYEPLIVHKYYRILVSTHMYEGAFGFSLIKKRARFWEPGRSETDILLDYLEKFSPIIIELDENLVVHGPSNRPN